jgi:hypothetical protein
MDIAKKLEYLKQYIDSIATHDDAPAEEVGMALSEAAKYANDAAGAAVERRAAAEAANEPMPE